MLSWEIGLGSLGRLIFRLTRVLQKGAGVRYLVILSAMLAGCTGKQDPEMRLGYFANLTHAQALLGVHSDEYAQAIAPTKLVTRVFNAGPSLMEALFAGEIDIG